MNLKQAKYVKTIAQCGSLTAAAKKLYVSQPSLSQMLRQIEDDIGLPIFDRTVSPFRITRETSSTARTKRFLPKRPLRTG
jgi:DNA-binding transcriptional LysR family regulator